MDWNSKCCMASAAICRKNWQKKAIRYASMSPLAPIGIPTSCAAWLRDLQIYGFLFQTSSGDDFQMIEKQATSIFVALFLHIWHRTLRFSYLQISGAFPNRD